MTLQTFLQAGPLFSRMNEHYAGSVAHQGQGQGWEKQASNARPWGVQSLLGAFQIEMDQRTWRVVYEQSVGLIRGKGKQLTFWFHWALEILPKGKRWLCTWLGGWGGDTAWQQELSSGLVTVPGMRSLWTAEGGPAAWGKHPFQPYLLAQIWTC